MTMHAKNNTMSKQIINENTADGEYTHFTYWHTELLNMHVWYSSHDGAADTFSEQTYSTAYFQTIRRIPF